MDQEYDVIVLGTGLKECIMSGLMSMVSGAKVLHMDRNSYYGAESASLNLELLYKKFRGDQKVPEALGRTRDYNVDLCPKFLMACGNLVKVLLRTKVTRYLEFKSIGGSYVLKDGKIYKVPATPSEALTSGLMGFMQKHHFRGFLDFVGNYDAKDPKTHKGLDVDKMKTKDLYKYYKLDGYTQTFTGHAIALHVDDSYVEQPARDTVEKCKLYAYSVSRYGNSPYIYPVWGLGGLPEGFSRLCAIHGGTYMLNKPVEEILYDAQGKVCGVKSQGEVAKCKKVICDPSYVEKTDKVKKIGDVSRCICILSHPIPNTNNADSAQIIIPAVSYKRKTDIYICCVSYAHKVAAEGKYIAVMNTLQETANPQAELEPAIKLLGKVDETFYWTTPLYVPTSDGSKDNVYVTESYDASTHFESATNEVLSLFQRITGKPLDLDTISAEPDDLDPAQQAEKEAKEAAAAQAAAAAAASSASSGAAAAAAATPAK